MSRFSALIALTAFALLSVGCSKSAAPKTATGTVLKNTITSTSPADLSSSSLSTSGSGSSSSFLIPEIRINGSTSSTLGYSTYSSGPSYSSFAGQIPAYCIRRYGQYGELILDPSDPAFDCSHGCKAPFSTCGAYPIVEEQYTGRTYVPPTVQYSAPSVGQNSTVPSTTQSQNHWYLQGLNMLGSSSSSESSLPDGNPPSTSSGSSLLEWSSSGSSLWQWSSSSSSPLSFKVGSGTNVGSAITGGSTNRTSIPEALFDGDMLCGKGVTIHGLIGGDTPISACIAGWKT